MDALGSDSSASTDYASSSNHSLYIEPPIDVATVQQTGEYFEEILIKQEPLDQEEKILPNELLQVIIKEENTTKPTALQLQTSDQNIEEIFITEPREFELSESNECKPRRRRGKGRKNLKETEPNGTIQVLTGETINTETYKCTECNKSFPWKTWLETHMQSHSKITEHQCNICEKYFTQRFGLTEHLKIHSGIKDHQCTICNKSFTKKFGLKRHMDSHTNLKKFECHLCHKKFLQKLYLKRHMPTHDQQEVQCEICQKTFSRPAHLKYHMVSHMETRKFECPVCNLKFLRSHQLKNHIETHNETKEYQCEICNRTFTRKLYLTEHMKSHAKKFECSVCYKKFSSNSHLNRHLKNHKINFESENTNDSSTSYSLMQ